MLKNTHLRAALFLISILVGGGIAASNAYAGDYIGTLAFEFSPAGTTAGPRMQCETTYVGGQAYSMNYLVTDLEDRQNALTSCSVLFDGALVGFYCSLLVTRTGVDETNIVHLNAVLAIEALEGNYIKTSLDAAGGGPVVAATEKGTVRFIPPFF